MSDVVAVTPRPTLTAADLAGETGGFGCNTGGGSLAGLLGLGLAAVALRRRQAAAAILATATLVAPSVAQAQDDDSGRPAMFQRDETPAWTNFEFQYASFQFADTNLQTSHGPSAGNIRLQAGLQIFRYGEIDLGIGYLFNSGFAVDAAGNTSREGVFTEWLPIDVSATLRLHIIDEQPIVPYAQIGLDYVFWRINKLDAEGRFRAGEQGGGKLGWHWGAGGNILLDLFAPRRASQLEATTGINDTWLVIEYRQSYVGQNSDGLDLSGWSISGGLKIDY